MRRGKGGENEVVSNPQRSPRSKKVLKSCYWAVRRRRRKASDEDRRIQMCLTVRLAELRRKKANALRRDDPVRRITTKGRHFRRAPRRSNGEEEGANRRHVPRWKEASRGRALIEESTTQDGKNWVISYRNSIEKRQDRRKGRTMHSNRSVSSTRLEEKAEVVCNDAHIDGMESKSSGMEKIVETLPHSVIPSCRRSSPSSADVGEGGDRDVEAVEPPESFQVRRGRRGSGERPDVRPTTSGRVGRRSTSSTRRRRRAGNHFCVGQSGVTRRKTPVDTASFRRTRGRRGGKA